MASTMYFPTYYMKIDNFYFFLQRQKLNVYTLIYVNGPGINKQTWNVRSMNQGKLEVVKQEMARVNVDILGISKLKWTGMGEFNS